MGGHAPKLANMGNAAVFQDDRARAVTNFHLHHNITHLDWPANSPDSSPIEHLWDKLERRRRPRLRPDSTLADVESFLLQEWDAIPQRKVQRLINSTRNRCQACMTARGDVTRYRGCVHFAK